MDPNREIEMVIYPMVQSVKITLNKSKTSWWFQPIWKMLVKMGIFPK